MVIRFGQIKLRGLTPRLVWDLFMILVAIVNLLLIVFDLTYLELRPFYQRTVPALVERYDPVKGIEPHRLTGSIVELGDRLATTVGDQGAVSVSSERLQRLRELTCRMVDENPFERAGLSRNLAVIQEAMARGAGFDAFPQGSGGCRRVAEAFWSSDPQVLARHVELYRDRIRPLLTVNYHRQFDLDGRLEDHFWKLDAPFLAFFALEFFIRWGLAVRRRTYSKWYVFPVVNWYDLLGIVPYKQFRLFRLFRLVSIYVRLHRSELTSVGEDPLSRLVGKLAAVLTEEVSDRVAIKLISEAQSEIARGTHADILRRTFEEHRAALEEILAARVADLVAHPDVQDRIREVSRRSVQAAVADGSVLRGVPLPRAVVAPLARHVGDIATRATLESLSTAFADDEGREVLRGLAASIFDELLDGPGARRLREVSDEIADKVLSEMRATFAVKRWAGGDRTSLTEDG